MNDALVRKILAAEGPYSDELCKVAREAQLREEYSTEELQRIHDFYTHGTEVSI